MSNTPDIDIRPDHWEIVRAILQKHVPQYEVWAFGSRAKWTAKEFSDLDLAIMTDEPLPKEISAALAGAFEESDLPYKIDVADWATLSEKFKSAIMVCKITIQIKEQPFSDLLLEVVDNRGKTCPTAPAGIPLIATNCVTNDTLYPVFEKIRYVSKETYSSWFRGHPEPGDILFVNKATPGRVCLVPAPVSFCIAQDMVAIRANKEKIYPPYLFAILRSPLVQKKIEQMHVGSLIPHFKKKDFDKLLIPTPPAELQKIIGDIYLTLSKKIEINRRMNETLESMARAIFKDWFVDFGPVLAKAESRQPERLSEDMAKLFPNRFDGEGKPKGWTIRKIAECCTLGRGASPRPISHYMGGDVPWIKIADATAASGPFLFSTKEKLKQEGVDKSISVSPGDLILSNSATCGLPKFVELTGCIHDGWLYFREYEHITKMYLYHILLELSEYLIHLADGSVQKNLNTNLVGQQLIVIPDKAVLDAFDTLTTTLFEKIRLNMHESHTLGRLRDTLLTKLVSGELRIKDVEKLVSEAV